MCIKWHVWFNIHVLSMRLPPPSPTKQCWYTHASYSFPVHYLWQHWFGGAGNRDFITQCPNSFVQDCIQRLKKFSTKIRKCLIKSKRAVGIAWFSQGTPLDFQFLHIQNIMESHTALILNYENENFTYPNLLKAVLLKYC